MATQDWFTKTPTVIADSDSRNGLHNTFDRVEERVEQGFDGVHDYLENMDIWGSNVMYVDTNLGVDEPNRGTVTKPYKSINYAYSQVSTVPDTQEGADQWLLEKLIFWCAPGVYTEGGTFDEPVDVEVGIKRARVSVQGDGVYIRGNLAFKYDIQWVPGGWDYVTEYRPNQKFPYDAAGSGTATLVSFDVSGDTGGMEAGHPAMNIMTAGAVQIRYGSTEEGPVNAWQSMFGPMQAQVSKVQTFGGLNVMAAEGEVVTGNNSLTVEIDDSCISGTYLGSSLPGTAMTLKAHNSQLRSQIGPYVTVIEIDNCRIQGGFNREVLGGAGNVTFSGASSYAHIRDCAVPASVFNVGNGTANVSIYTDELTGKLLNTKTLDAGTGSVTVEVMDIHRGTTAQRPTTACIGYRYFDTTLNQPIWMGSADWVDATGTPV